ncbi:MAG: hypothetical protein RR387_07295, partial [Clostridiales bacterium]
MLQFYVVAADISGFICGWMVLLFAVTAISAGSRGGRRYVRAGLKGVLLLWLLLLLLLLWLVPWRLSGNLILGSLGGVAVLGILGGIFGGCLRQAREIYRSRQQ